jgi:hypothetical protein
VDGRDWTATLAIIAANAAAMSGNFRMVGGIVFRVPELKPQ